MVNSLKDLEKLLKLAQKYGILAVKIGDFEIKLSDSPRPTLTRRSKAEDNKEPDVPILSDEELLFWSTSNIGAQ